MLEIKGNLWEIAYKYDAVCITTNGFVKSNGEAVMGRGIAEQAKKKFPNLPRILGKHIRDFGNVPGLLSYTGQYSIISFPVKHHWREHADIFLIKKSCELAMLMAHKFIWENILLPKPGCGNGHLDWDNLVKPNIKDILDDRFTIIDLK